MSIRDYYKKGFAGNTLCVTFAPTVLTTLPVRSASQGESFITSTFFYKLNTPPRLAQQCAAHLGGLFFFGRAVNEQIKKKLHKTT